MDRPNYPEGLLFESALLEEIREKLCYVDRDSYGKRIFFENSGGSFRLKSCVEAVVAYDSHPDCQGGRQQQQAKDLDALVEQGIRDLRVLFGTDKGSIVTCLSASQVMFNIVQVIAGAVPGTNMVVSELEHPSGYDSVESYAGRTDCELRVLRSNPVTGGIDPEEVEKHVDKGTVLLGCMYSSNVTGAVHNIPEIVRRAVSFVFSGIITHIAP